MSFLNIKDRNLRDKMIEDYLAVKKRLKERNMNERMDDLAYRDELEDTFKPIVDSNERFTQEIINELKPLSNELVDIKKNIHSAEALSSRPKIGSKRKLVSSNGPLTDVFLHKYMNGNVDKMFGIRYENDNFMMGDKVVQFQGDNIIIDGEVYLGTPGLWSLITDKDSKQFNPDDYERYKELLYETQVLYRNFDSASSYPRANKSRKWKKILAPIWDDFQRDGIITSDDDDKYMTSIENDGDGLKMYLQRDGHCFNIHHKGNGIHFTLRPHLTGTQGRDGLFVRVGSSLYDGEGLLLGPKSPFRNIPILNLLL